MENLTRAKAQVELLNKNVISHKDLKDVYVFLDSENNLIDNKGNILIKYEFWINRVGTEEFDNGWFIVKNLTENCKDLITRKEKYSERFDKKLSIEENMKTWGQRVVIVNNKTKFGNCDNCNTELTLIESRTGLCYNCFGDIYKGEPDNIN